MAESKNKLDAKNRESFGKGASRQLRRDGFVPAVMYAKEQKPKHVSLPTRELAAILRENGTNAVIELNVDGKDQLVLTKQVDVHPIRDYIEHVDLMMIKKGEKVTVEVPVIAIGDIAAGAQLMQDANNIEIEAEVLNIPEEIEVSVEGLDIGSQILAKDIKLPKGVTLVSDADMLVFNIVEPETQQVEPDTATEEVPVEATKGEAAEEAKEESKEEPKE